MMNEENKKREMLVFPSGVYTPDEFVEMAKSLNLIVED